MHHQQYTLMESTRPTLKHGVEEPIFALRVRVLEAKDLPADGHGHTRGHIDPYVELEAQPNHHQIFRTKMLKNTHNPVWNAECEFHFHQCTRIDFKVYTYDVIHDHKLLGLCTWEFFDTPASLPQGEWTEKWLPLPTNGALKVAVCPVDFDPSKIRPPGVSTVDGLTFPVQREFHVKHEALAHKMLFKTQDDKVFLTAKSKLLSWGEKIKVVDESDTTIFYIKQTGGWPHQEFEVYKKGKGGPILCHIHKTTFFSDEFELRLPNDEQIFVSTKGDQVSNAVFNFKQNDKEIAKIYKPEESTQHDTYMITVEPNVNCILIFACCIIFHKIVSNSKSNRPRTNSTGIPKTTI